jgi:cysteine desulfurase
MPDRIYLDWNATAPLRPEARAAMIAAMDVVGNPSSVHTEGRAAKMIVEKAREQVAALVGCVSDEVVFTSGATEAAALAVFQKAHFGNGFVAFPTEHDCVWAWSEHELAGIYTADGTNVGAYADLFGGAVLRMKRLADSKTPEPVLIGMSAGNSETGMYFSEKSIPCDQKISHLTGGTVWHPVLCDAVQAAGKISIKSNEISPSYMILSGHKIGSAKGIGCLVNRSGKDIVFAVRGGGQEKGRRSGTENVIGIAGFGAAAEAAQRELDASAWEPIAELRDDLESALRDCAGEDLTIFGENAPRLPNTSCFAIPGWKGETQVMQLDLAGFAVSAGSACSSGKVGPSRVLKAMGYDDITASSAIRVSMGATTTKDEVSHFIDAWTGLYKRMKTRAA